MDNNDTIVQSPYTNILGGSGDGLLPESFTTLLIVSFVVLNILALLFMVFWIMGMVRRWKVQSAVLAMQKDIAEIKQQLTPGNTPAKVQQPAQTEATSQSTASSDDTTPQSSL